MVILKTVFFLDFVVMANITDKKLIKLVAERSILFDLSNQLYYDQLRKDNVWDG